MARKGPGLLLRDILKGEAGVASAQAAINAVNPDILTLQSFDYDLTGAALTPSLTAWRGLTRITSRARPILGGRRGLI